MYFYKYTLGTVVRERDGDPANLYAGKDKQPMFGHIVGFDQVEFDDHYETILKVQWQDGSTRSINPSRVIFEYEYLEDSEL